MANNDISQQNLKEPDQVDWDNAFTASKYTPPPPAIGPDGKEIVYHGKVAEIKETQGYGLDKDHLNFQIDLVLTNSGSYDGQRVRTWVSNRTFQRRNPETGEFENLKGNPNALAKFLRSAGVSAKPQTNSEYRAAVRAVNGKSIPFTIDWEAKNKETQETVRGYVNFPEDPERPGQKKSILKAGDVVQERDRDGNVTGEKVISSEVLFANPRVKYFQAATPKVSR